MPVLNDIDTILHSDFKCERIQFEEEDVGMKIDVNHNGCQCLFYKYDKKLSREYKGGLFPFLQKMKASVKLVIILYLQSVMAHCTVWLLN